MGTDRFFYGLRTDFYDLLRNLRKSIKKLAKFQNVIYDFYAGLMDNISMDS